MYVFKDMKRLLFIPVSITPLIDTEDALLVAHRVNSNITRNVKRKKLVSDL